MPPPPPADAADVETLWSSSDLYGNITDDDAGWDWTILKFMDYLGMVKAENQNFHIILNNNWNRCNEAGARIMPLVQKCHTMEPANGGGFKATLHTQNAFCVNDRCELRVSANGENKKDAISNVCCKALALLLLTDASKVLLQDKQWQVPCDAIYNTAMMMKGIYVQRWARSAIGECTIGDEEPRVQPLHSRAIAGLSYEPPQGPEQQQERDQMITTLLNMEIAAHGVAWPFQLHRGRWRLLDKLLPPRVGALKEWVQARPKEFKIILDNRQRWGIIKNT